MARTVRNAKIDSRSARAKLARRREPYWTVLSRGCAVGYRKGKNGGSWIARRRAPEGKQHYRTLGAADDALDRQEGAAVLSYAEAQDRARAWFAEIGYSEDLDAPSGPYTVAEAMADYLADYQSRGGKAAKDARTRAEALILPTLGAIELPKLSAKQVRNWHTGLAEAPPRLRTCKGEAQRYREVDGDPEAIRRRRATANRTLSILKAALNHAWAEGKVASDDAWRRVKPFREADAARVHSLNQDQVRRLVNACNPEFRPLAQAALFSGARYGELCALRVADFNPDAGTVHVRQSKAGRSRHVVLTEEGRRFFESMTAGRHGDEIMFPRPDGKPWGKSHQARPLREACRRARITSPASFHTLRHTYASLLVMGGVPLPVVAQNLGHSDTRMCERHYAHLAPNYVAEAIRAGAPKLEIFGSSTVAPLRTKMPAGA